MLDSLLNTFFAHIAAPGHLSEAAFDHDYSLRALQVYNEGAKAFMSQTTLAIRGLQPYVVEPIREFLNTQVRPYREAKRGMDHLQRNFDQALLRYQGQGKNKEASSLREDAFQLFEARRAYTKASMDVCVLGPQLRLALDTLIIRVFSDQWFKITDIRQGNAENTRKLGREISRIRSWGKDLAANERVLRRELLMARKEMEAATITAARPARDLDSYSLSTVAYLGQRPQTGLGEPGTGPPARQGWLLQRIIAGRPARYVWARRWFFVRNGIFGYLLPNDTSGAVEESEKIGVLLCGVRPAFKEDRRFCFEIKTSDTGMLLQAETQEELTEWIAVFEKAKRLAIEDPSTTELLPSSGQDAAFAISPALAPEFAVKSQDKDDDGPSTTSIIPDAESNVLPSRATMDPNSLRKDRHDEGEKSRDHAARIMQKLDLHRKGTAPAQVSKGNVQPPGGGIASLISASHGTILGPAGANVAAPSQRTASMGRLPSISLAPETLVMPPAPTSLSKSAIMIGMERPSAVQASSASSGNLPGGLLANHWGAANYGYMSRLERGEIGQKPEPKPVLTPMEERERRFSDPPDPLEKVPFTAEPESTTDEVLTDKSSPARHRKTTSAQEEGLPRLEPPPLHGEYPAKYPLPLRAHDAQFRLLFPDVPLDERVVLIARVSWSLNDTQDLPGRAFITTAGIYFYSHHLGLVMVVGFDLESIMEVSTSIYQDYDVLHVTIRPKSEKEDPSLVTIKTFLEPVQLLKRRIDYLIDNACSEEPDGLEVVIQKLLAFEKMQFPGDAEQSSPPSSGWEDVGSLSYRDNGPSSLLRRDIPVKVDRNPYGGDGTMVGDAEPTRFRLPARAVHYTPTQVTHQAVERVFDVSAKALFHMMFGDQSALYQMLYRARRGKNITQSPWEMDNLFHRSFTYTVDTTDAFQRPKSLSVTDTQAIEMSNDHLCYVVTDSRAPWHLPYPDDFRLLSKVVITHDAKSRAKLAIWTNVIWSRPPVLSRKMIERHAFDDLHIDAMQTAEIVADQVSRLGPGFTTKKAVVVFGHIGRQTQAASIVAADDEALLPRAARPNIIKHSLIGIVSERAKSLALSAASTIFMSLIGLSKAVLKAFSAHTILLVLLALTVSTQMMTGSAVVKEWWTDRSASRFMRRMGVRPDAHMARAIYLHDLPTIFSTTLAQSAWNAGNQSHCSSTFASLVSESDPALGGGGTPSGVNASAGSSTFPIHDQRHRRFGSPSTSSTARRLGAHRLRLATQRHDLLVALRLVNRVEKETIQAEWENWLLDEGVRCQRVGRILHAADSSTAGEVKKSRREALRQWYDEYCESCRREREGLGMGLGSGL